MRYILLTLCIACLMVSCGHPSVPTTYIETSDSLTIYPDYREVTIPANLAPINFMVDDASIDECIAQIDYPGGVLTYGKGRKVIFDNDEWLKILQSSRGQSITITLYTRHEGQWSRHPAFNVHIADDEIDSWLSYRLIEPSYVAFEKIDIMQRNLTSFEEQAIASTHIGGRKDQCINCHSYQNHKTENMVYHIRGAEGGTMLTYHGKTKLMKNLKREGMMSNPVYPAWHPTLPLLAFSINKTGQFFHTQSTAKVEVQDEESGLVLYDVERDKMTIIPSAMEDLDNFPTWSPDGKKLSYTSAHYDRQDSTVTLDRDLANHYTNVQYNLYVRDFDPENRTVGERILVLDMVSNNLSASLPRVSPDGNKLLYAAGQFGCFHIWHSDADIRCLNLQTMQIDSLQILNSHRADSYPSWSNNGRWIILASRREDGNYSRVYISYYDAEGRAHKAFVVPQADPEHDKLLLRSYNRPETMIEKAAITN